MHPREPIFIVGVQRSGTTLLAAMLSAHSAMSCGPETHFFRRLSQTDPYLLCQQQTWPDPAIEFILSITHSNFTKEEKTSLIKKYQLSENEIINYLQNHPPSVRSILSSVTEQFMAKTGKKRWIEKTPDHINHLQLIRKYFAHSPIIRIVRDPRDVALSLNKVPWGSDSLLSALIKWKQLDLSSNDFFLSDQISYTIYYEKLIKSPTIELKKICNFLGEKYEDQMQDTNSSGKLLNSRNVTWKAKASQPLDLTRIYRWKSDLTPSEKRMAEAMIGDRIKAHEYDLEGTFRYFGELFPEDFLAIKYKDELDGLFQRDIRFWKQIKSERATIKVFLGDPSSDSWIKKNKIFGLLNCFFLAITIYIDKAQKKSIYWIIKNNDDKWSGFNAFILKKVLSSNKINLTS